MSARPKYESVDAYIAAAPLEARDALNAIRSIIKAQVPDAVEIISYQIPAFRLKRIFIFFAAFKNHIGVYPPVQGDPELQMALAPYRGEKGNLKFPLKEPIPYDLISRVAAALAQENG